jgi:hypothetical protein
MAHFPFPNAMGAPGDVKGLSVAVRMVYEVSSGAMTSRKQLPERGVSDKMTVARKRAGAAREELIEGSPRREPFVSYLRVSTNKQGIIGPGDRGSEEVHRQLPQRGKGVGRGVRGGRELAEPREPAQALGCLGGVQEEEGDLDRGKARPPDPRRPLPPWAPEGRGEVRRGRLPGGERADHRHPGHGRPVGEQADLGEDQGGDGGG